MKQVTPGIYQITRGANMFLLETAPDELTLIDTGIPGSRSTVLNAVQQLGKTPHQLKHILVTHADIDHAGSLHGIAQATGATVYASEKSVPYLRDASTPPHIPAVMKVLTSPLQSMLQKAATVDKEVRNGQTLNIGGGIQVIAVPGHTPDNVAYYWEDKQTVFAADLFFAQNGLGLTPAPISWDMDAAKESARKVLALQPTIICTGHGNAVNLVQTPNASAALQQQLNSTPMAAGVR